MTPIHHDAEAYGVEIIPAEVEPGQVYWKAIRVHHLTPQENNLRHHLFLDAVDEEGHRLYGSLFTVAWDGGSDIVILEEDGNELGANYPMWKWQICRVEVMGAPSDRVVHLHTAHPEEPPGNTLFHHSFAITFQRAIAREEEHPASSILRGRVPAGQGHTLSLLDENQVVHSLVVGKDERYRFLGLPAGTYLVRDDNDLRIAGPIALNGRDEAILDLPGTLPQNAVFERFVLFEPPQSPQTQVYLSLLSDMLTKLRLPFGFDPMDASQALHVLLVGDHPQETLDLLAQAGRQVEALPQAPEALLQFLDTLA